MAAAASPPADGAPAPGRKGPSLVIQVAMLLVTTLMAGGMGFLGGGFLHPGGGEAPAPEPPAAMHEKPEAGHEKKGEGKEEAAEAVPGQPAIVPLAPITTNLAAPTGTWLRLELALQFKDLPEPGMAETVTEDFLSYLRTMKLHQIAGPSGFLHLKEDLDERAKIRSGGKVTDVFVRAMIFE